MKTITITVLNEKVLNLLKELEAMDLIKMLSVKSKPRDLNIKKKASDYKGIIPPRLRDKMQEHIQQSRNEWNRT